MILSEIGSYISEYALSGQKVAAVMCLDCKIKNNTGLHRSGKPHRHELFGAPECT